LSFISLKIINGHNFIIGHIDSFRELKKYIFENPKGPATSGKLFLKSKLKLTGMEVSLNKLNPRESIPFYHRHEENEELYIFISGKGQFQVDREIIDVQEGSIIKVSPLGVRAWRNNSSEDLYFIVIQAKSGSFSGENISDGVGIEGDVEWS
jgi:mannose-6-phosphate isomerase-like protein (cupin superfamily)